MLVCMRGGGATITADRRWLGALVGVAACCLLGCGTGEGGSSSSTTSVATAAAPAPSISKGHAEADWTPYFKEAASTGPGTVEGIETFCTKPSGRGWKCIGGAAIPSQGICWIEEAVVESRENISVQGVPLETEMNPPGDPAGRCKL